MLQYNNKNSINLASNKYSHRQGFITFSSPPPLFFFKIVCELCVNLGGGAKKHKLSKIVKRSFQTVAVLKKF
jgi:hypothetical protein